MKTDSRLSAATDEQRETRDGSYSNVLRTQLAPLKGPIYVASQDEVEPFWPGNPATTIQDEMPRMSRALLMSNECEASVLVLQEILTELLNDSEETPTPDQSQDTNHLDQFKPE